VEDLIQQLRWQSSQPAENLLDYTGVVLEKQRTGMTSFPIPSAGIIPMVRDLRAEVAIERIGARNILEGWKNAEIWQKLLKEWRGHVS